MLMRLWFCLLQLLGRDPRGIFWYWNGRTWQSADPIVAARSLLSDPEFSWDETPALTDDQDPAVVVEAVRISAGAARRAFGLKSIEDGGLTETECCRILWAFRQYLGAVKKNGSGPPTSPEPTGATPSEAASATNAGSVSGSTATELDSSGLGTPGREQPSPSTTGQSR